MTPCPSCHKDILVGSPTCFYCGTQVSADAGPTPPETGESLIRSQIKQVLTEGQSHQETQSQ